MQLNTKIYTLKTLKIVGLLAANLTTAPHKRYVQRVKLNMCVCVLFVRLVLSVTRLKFVTHRRLRMAYNPTQLSCPHVQFS